MTDFFDALTADGPLWPDHHPDSLTFDAITALQREVDAELRREGYPMRSREPRRRPSPARSRRERRRRGSSRVAPRRRPTAPTKRGPGRSNTTKRAAR